MVYSHLKPEDKDHCSGGVIVYCFLKFNKTSVIHNSCTGYTIRNKHAIKIGVVA